MRIGVNAALVGKRHSGVASYIAGLADCLADLGHDVIVYTSSPSIQNGTRAHFRRTCGLLAFDRGPFASVLRFLWNQIVLPLRVMRDGVDMIFSQNVDGMLWPPVPQVLVVHDIIPLLYPEEAPRLHEYYKFLVPRLMRRVDCLVTVSDASRKDLARHYGISSDKISVACDGVNGELANPSHDSKPSGLDCESFFLFVGTFSPRKNLATVIQALAKVRLDIAESLLVVAYPDNWMAPTVQKIAELGISDRVIFLDSLRHAELSYVYRHATALFLLSEYEGFGLPALEAMLAGTPAVVSDTAALAEVVDDAAIKIRAHDAEAAAEAMRRLSLEPPFREEWRQRGLERARLFTWQRTGEQLRTLLQPFS